MIFQNLRRLLLLLLIICGFTSCAGVNYTGEQPVKNNFALVFASTTADVSFGSALVTYITLENVQTKNTLTLRKGTCILTKDSPGMGLIAQAALSTKTQKDQISVNNICGNLVVGEIEAGEYELKALNVACFDLAYSRGTSTMTYIPPIKQTFNIHNNEILYLGHIETNIFDMRRNFSIKSASISMDDNYEYDSTIFKQTYQRFENPVIKNNAISLENKMFKE